MNIRFSTFHLTGEERKYITRAFELNEVSTYGQKIFNLENELKNDLGKDTFITCLSSGTAAITWL